MSPRTRDGAPHPVDIHVGQRVREIRQQAGLSLTAVATRICVAFQQLQKYEAGTNRVSASMLYRLARALKVPVATFFDGLASGPCAAGGHRERLMKLEALLRTPDGVEVVDAVLALPPVRGPTSPHSCGRCRTAILGPRGDARELQRARCRTRYNL